MSKILSITASMEHHEVPFTIKGGNGNYNGLALMPGKLDIMANGATFDSCRIQMETAIDSYLTTEYFSLPVVVGEGSIAPINFYQVDEDMRLVFAQKQGKICFRKIYDNQGNWIASERSLGLPVIKPNQLISPL